jgi:hypothetical protein
MMRHQLWRGWATELLFMPRKQQRAVGVAKPAAKPAAAKAGPKSAAAKPEAAPGAAQRRRPSGPRRAKQEGSGEQQGVQQQVVLDPEVVGGEVVDLGEEGGDEEGSSQQGAAQAVEEVEDQYTIETELLHCFITTCGRIFTKIAICV